YSSRKISSCLTDTGVETRGNRHRPLISHIEMLLVTLFSVIQLSMPSWTRADDDWFSLWDSPYK
ncbi:unnamed protein product, partial [Candidula unifasciata]